MHATDTPRAQSKQSSSVTFAAQVRAGSPGRGTSVSEISRLSAVEFARVVRSNAPGRTKR
jgi:hypothetical protein